MSKLVDDAGLYLITDVHPASGPLEKFLPLVLEAGVDMIQLRDKDLPAAQLEPYCRLAQRICMDFGVPFIVNDHLDLAAALGVGLHVGQEDTAVRLARARLGRDCIIGLSTHSPKEIADAGAGPDYIGVGPVFATPTKPGRPAVGTGLVGEAARRAKVPFFAIGGIDESTLAAVVKAGARRVAVLRAITGSQDPAGATRVIKAALSDAVSGLH